MKPFHKRRRALFSVVAVAMLVGAIGCDRSAGTHQAQRSSKTAAPEPGRPEALADPDPTSAGSPAAPIGPNPEDARAASGSPSAGGSSTLRANLPLRIIAELPDLPRYRGRGHFFNTTLAVEKGKLFLWGCVASAKGSCRGTWRHELTGAEEHVLDERLDAIKGMPRCAKVARAPSDRDLEITWGHPPVTSDGFWAGTAAALRGAKSSPCQAVPALIWALVEMSPAAR